MEPSPKKPNVRHWWEWIAILLAIASLWPLILHWQHPIWKCLLYVMLGVMIIVAVRKIRRIRQLGRQRDDQP